MSPPERGRHVRRRRRGHRRIRWRRNSALTVALLTAAVLPGQPAEVERLWQRAVAVAAANRHWTVTELTYEGRELDAAGATTQVEVATYQLAPAADGLIQVARQRNGAAVAVDPEPLPERVLQLPSPFDRQQHGQVDHQWLSADQVSGVPCQRFSFRQPARERRTLVGTTCLHAEHGHALELTFTLERLPPLVQELDNTIVYRDDAAFWVPLLLSTRVRGGLLGGRRFASVVRFTAWRGAELSIWRGAELSMQTWHWPIPGIGPDGWRTGRAGVDARHPRRARDIRAVL